MAAFIAVANSACQKQEASPVYEPLPPVAVRTAVVQLKMRPSSEEVVGTVRSKLRAAIEPKVSSRIEALLVTPGQTVKAGDLIAQLDAREIQAKLDQAFATAEQATSDLGRARELMEKKITTQADFDAAKARERVAAGLLKEAETMLAYTRVLAPFDGIVTRQRADVGDLATPGKPIVEMEDPRALRFEADVPEALIGNIERGAKLPVRIGASSTSIEGTVIEMAPVADPGSRTFLVKLDLPITRFARSGQFGRVWIPTGERQTVRVPASSVVTRGQVEGVFVIVKNRAQLRIVRTGRSTEGEVELLSGVSDGESIVVEGVEQLRDGQLITLKP
jgi:RND family efflux transporter MFP subunit